MCESVALSDMKKPSGSTPQTQGSLRESGSLGPLASREAPPQMEEGPLPDADTGLLEAVCGGGHQSGIHGISARETPQPLGQAWWVELTIG